MSIPDHISESIEKIVWVKILKFFLLRIRDPGIFLAMDLGRKIFGSRINIPDPQLWNPPSRLLYKNFLMKTVQMSGLTGLHCHFCPPPTLFEKKRN